MKSQVPQMPKKCSPNESELAVEEQQFSDASESGLCIQGNYDG